MWSGGWQQWPIQQAMYQNVPHEQVDWAALAKQWIDMQRDGPSAPAPPSGPAPPPVITCTPSAAVVNLQPTIVTTTPLVATTVTEPFRPQTILAPVSRNDMLPIPSTRPPAPVLNLNKPPEPPVNSETPTTFWNNSWEPNNAAPVSSNWPPPAPSVPPPVSEKAPFNFGNSMHGNLPLQAQSYDYNHGSDPYVSQQSFSSNEGPFPHYWTSSGSENVPPFLRKDSRPRGDENLSMNSDDMNQMCNLDAAKRKQLPIWIREGLEKMERDRHRQQEKERLKQEYEEKRASQAHATSGDLDADDDKEPVIKKSRFDSESEEEGHDIESKKPVEKLTFSSNASVLREVMTEEEMMFKVRRMLTEILLEVTNEELTQVAKEVHQRARSKAPARQLASSTALASITGILGGLSGYSSGGSNNGESEPEESSGDENSDEELLRIIMEKKSAFVLKELEIEAMLKAEENEQMKERALKKEPSLQNSDQGKLEKTQMPEVPLTSESSEVIKPVPDVKHRSPNSRETSSDSEGSEISKHSHQIPEKSGKLSESRLEGDRGKKRDFRSRDSRTRSRSVSVESSSTKAKGKNTNAFKRDTKIRSRRNRRSKSRDNRSRSRNRENRRSRSRSRNRNRQIRNKNRRSRSRERSSRGTKTRKRSRSRDSKSRHRSRSPYRRSRDRNSRVKGSRERERNKNTGKSKRKNRSSSESQGKRESRSTSIERSKSSVKEHSSRSGAKYSKHGRSRSPSELKASERKGRLKSPRRRKSSSSSSDSSLSGKKSS